MAVWVYKDGESFLIQPSRLQQHLQSGYSTSKEVETVEESIDEVGESSETESDELESLRKEAKEKGIKGYQRMKVETLKEKLGYDS